MNEININALIADEHLSEQELFEKLYEALSVEGHLFYAAKLLQRAAQKAPNRTALIYKDQHISYFELYQRASMFARLLKERGIKKGDRILMCFENSSEFYIAYFAIWQIGAVVAPLNTFLQEVELAHIITDAQPAMIITEKDRVDLFTKSNEVLPPLLTEEDMPLSVSVPQEFINDEVICLEPNAMAALLYTSGTTGLPKGVMLSSNNIMTNLLQGLARLRLVGHERVFGVLPFFHVFAQFACIWGSLFVQATVIVIPKIDRRYILDGLKHKPTFFIGVPALYGLMCLLKTAPLDSVDYFVSGGDALPDKIRSYFALLYRRKICNGYGLTETSPLVSIDFADMTTPTNSVGRLVVDLQCAIRDEKGRDLAQGEIGEIWLKGDNVMLGYYQAPEMTAAVLRDGWFNTGDLGYLDDKNNLLITGRVKDLIIHKGLNIYPQEIENIIVSHPNVLRVGVIGQKDEDVGEVPIAFVQLRKEQPSIEKELKQLCDQHLAPYKVPRSFICVTEELATTATGKVDKKVLRKQIEKK